MVLQPVREVRHEQGEVRGGGGVHVVPLRVPDVAAGPEHGVQEHAADARLAQSCRPETAIATADS